MPSKESGRIAEKEVAAAVYSQVLREYTGAESFEINVLMDPSIRINSNTIITYWVPGADTSNLNSRVAMVAGLSASRPNYRFVASVEPGLEVVRKANLFPHYEFNDGPHKTPIRSMLEGKDVFRSPPKSKEQPLTPKKEPLVGQQIVEDIPALNLTTSKYTGRTYNIATSSGMRDLQTEIAQRQLIQAEVLKEWGLAGSDTETLEKIVKRLPELKEEVKRRMKKK